MLVRGKRAVLVRQFGVMATGEQEWSSAVANGATEGGCHGASPSSPVVSGGAIGDTSRQFMRRRCHLKARRQRPVAQRESGRLPELLNRPEITDFCE
jgi:hypothetical protein